MKETLMPFLWPVGGIVLCVGIVETLRFMALGLWRMFR